jgi:nonribosomal peptide synthetase protein BlmIII
MDPASANTTYLIDPEQRALWDSVNDTVADRPAVSVGEAFLAQAAARPDKPALVAATRTLSYVELARHAAAVVSRLRGAEPGPVAVCVEPGWEQAVAVLGAMLAGVPFHAIEPYLAQPSRWWRLADTETRTVLTQSWWGERTRWPDGTDIIAVDELTPADSPAGPPVPPGTVACMFDDPHSAAMVPVTHDALVNTMTALADRFSITDEDRLLAVNPLGDEIALSAILAPLLSGGTVVVPNDIDIRTPAAWLTLIDREAVTIWHSSPTLAALLVEQLQVYGDDDTPMTLRLALLGGEPLTYLLVERLRGALDRSLRIVNLGACAVAGLWATAFETGESGQSGGHVPIGGPLTNKQVYVFTEASELCPVGVTGRLHVSGRGLLGARLFDATPADLASVAPMHRTDLHARLLPDGVIDVVGDDAARTVVHGHPLNLREVEAALATHAAVLAAAVVPTDTGPVAYVRTVPGTAVAGADLLAHLRTRVSPHLLPGTVELLAALPLTAAGRVDRSMLVAGAFPARKPPGR